MAPPAPAWLPIDRLPDGLPDGTILHPGAEGTVEARSDDGVHRWLARRMWRRSSYATPGPGGMPIMHSAAMIDHHLVASADGGETWTAVARTGTAALAIDSRGRVWVAGGGGVDVADAREAIAGRDDAWKTLMRAGAGCIAVDGGGRVIAGTGGATWSCPGDGESEFAQMPAKATEKGAWGSYELNATGLRALRRAPDGAVWGVLDNGVVRIAPGAARWQSVNLGLTVIAGKGMRGAHVEVTALAFAADGTAYLGTRGHGSFCRPPAEV